MSTERNQFINLKFYEINDTYDLENFMSVEFPDQKFGVSPHPFNDTNKKHTLILTMFYDSPYTVLFSDTLLKAWNTNFSRTNREITDWVIMGGKVQFYLTRK